MEGPLFSLPDSVIPSVVEGPLFSLPDSVIPSVVEGPLFSFPDVIPKRDQRSDRWKNAAQGRSTTTALIRVPSGKSLVCRQISANSE